MTSIHIDERGVKDTHYDKKQSISVWQWEGGYRLILSLCAKEQYDHTSLILSCYNTTLIDLLRYNIKENDFLFLLSGTYIQCYGEATTYDRFFSTYLSYWKFFFYETVPTIDFLYKEKPITFFLA